LKPFNTGVLSIRLISRQRATCGADGLEFLYKVNVRSIGRRKRKQAIHRRKTRIESTPWGISACYNDILRYFAKRLFKALSATFVLFNNVLSGKA